MSNSYVTPSHLTAPQFDESDAELSAWRIEQANTTDQDRLRELDQLIRERMAELQRLR